MFVKGLFSRYWRYLFAFICGCAAITTGPSCVTGGRNPGGGGGGGGAPLLIITSIASSNISDIGATISWKTNRAADSQVEYGVSTTYGNVVSLKTQDTDHQLTLFGLNSETLYHFRVKSNDGANQSTSGDLTFTTSKSSSKPDFALSATSTNLTRGLTANSAITITRSNGFADAVALSATGLPSGVTVQSFNPASTTGGSSTLTLVASSTAATGTTNVTISGAGGGLTRSTTFALTVTVPVTPDFTLSASPGSLTVN